MVINFSHYHITFISFNNHHADDGPSNASISNNHNKYAEHNLGQANVRAKYNLS